MLYPGVPVPQARFAKTNRCTPIDHLRASTRTVPAF